MEAINEASLEPERAGRSYRLAEFEGPLDLLLFLIKKNEVNIYDIPIASITEQFIASLSEAEAADLDDLTEFYMLAATLLYIKSRMLLPVEMNLADEIEDPRRDLVEKLIEYQKFKKLSELMEKKELEVEWTIERTKMQRPLPFGDEELWDKIDVWDLLKSFSGLMGGMSSERIIDMYEEVSINEKTALIHELLESRESFGFHDLVTRSGSLLDIVCAFLAVLEAVKYRVISIHQHRLFGDIQIRRHERRGTDGTEP
ncbi:MAG TPA: segregation/condensation protein A [Spirochaetales bacterium]|nr:segregation/condensation protein A [Spirochaetales bacterium]HPB65938.1 segregation/condensation protein A [Spirochaetales bacterium]HPG85740.1 segregation/condensation protein A [Spirochaetales bacterium]HPM73069.1 segregation/condensation protein A [Spirochaetales bacterium]